MLQAHGMALQCLPADLGSEQVGRPVNLQDVQH